MENINLTLDLSKLNPEEAKDFITYIHKIITTASAEGSVPLHSIAPGTAFHYQGSRWLKIADRSAIEGEFATGVYAVLEANRRMHYSLRFDVDCWESDVQEYIDDVICSQFENTSDFLFWEQVSQPLDGSDNGQDDKKVMFALPSFDFYRANYSAFNKNSEFFQGDWWLFTTHTSCGNAVCAVYSDGTVQFDFADSCNYVYPMACLKSDTAVFPIQD